LGTAASGIAHGVALTGYDICNAVAYPKGMWASIDHS